jgi:hypothetical protein
MISPAVDEMHRTGTSGSPAGALLRMLTRRPLTRPVAQSGPAGEAAALAA